MILHKRFIAVGSIVSMLAGLAFVAGCGGGTASKPTVTARPVKDGGGTKQGATGNGDPKTGGTGGFGSLTGSIVFAGAPPMAPLVTASKDDICKAVMKKEMVRDNSLVVDPTSKGIKNVVIYIQNAPTGKAKIEKKQYDNHNCMFEPRVLAVQVGQPIEIRNLDATPHNTKVSTLNNEAIDSKLSAKAGDKIESSTIQYAVQEDTPLGVNCAFHPWMSGWHLVFGHPFFAQTDKDGKFEIKDIPAGKHTIIVWHENRQLLSTEITIEKDKAAELNQKFDAAKFATAGPPPTKSVVLNFGR